MPRPKLWAASVVTDGKLSSPDCPVHAEQIPCAPEQPPMPARFIAQETIGEGDFKEEL